MIEGETVETIVDSEDATTHLEQFRIITIPIAQRLTLTAAAAKPRSGFGVRPRRGVLPVLVRRQRVTPAILDE